MRKILRVTINLNWQQKVVDSTISKEIDEMTIGEIDKLLDSDCNSLYRVIICIYIEIGCKKYVLDEK